MPIDEKHLCFDCVFKEIEGDTQKSYCKRIELSFMQDAEGNKIHIPLGTTVGHSPHPAERYENCNPFLPIEEDQTFEHPYIDPEAKQNACDMKINHDEYFEMVNERLQV